MEGRPVQRAPVIEQSVAAMMRRDMSAAESHLILGPDRFGLGNRWRDEPEGR